MALLQLNKAYQEPLLFWWRAEMEKYHRSGRKNHTGCSAKEEKEAEGSWFKEMQLPVDTFPSALAGCQPAFLLCFLQRYREKRLTEREDDTGYDFGR